jgi:Protein of unknown function (DUF2637)
MTVRDRLARRAVPAADRLIGVAAALAVVAVVGVAAIISYQHAYELDTSHGETGMTAHLLSFTVDGPLLRQQAPYHPCSTSIVCPRSIAIAVV